MSADDSYISNLSTAWITWVAKVPCSCPIAKHILLDKPLFKVGRLKDAVDLHLYSAKVPAMISRQHAHFKLESDSSTHNTYRWILTDNSSLNGTFVNGLKLSSNHVLSNNDLIIFGRNSSESEFVFKFEQSDSSLPPLSRGITKMYKLEEAHRNALRTHRELESKYANQQAQLDEQYAIATNLKSEIAHKKRKLEEIHQSQIKDKEERDAKLRKLETETALICTQKAEMELRQKQIEAARVKQNTALQTKIEDLQNKVLKRVRCNNQLTEELNCCICSQLLLRATTLPCAHIFCEECIYEWFDCCEGSKSCPKCRTPVLASTKPTLSTLVNNTVELLAGELLDQTELQRRTERLRLWDESKKARNRRLEE